MDTSIGMHMPGTSQMLEAWREPQANFTYRRMYPFSFPKSLEFPASKIQILWDF